MVELVRLTIKGTPEDARKAASARGVELSEVVQRPNEYTIAQALMKPSQVSEWFGEPGSAPFPVGSLLLFGYIRD